MSNDARPLAVRELELRRAPGLGSDTVHLADLADGVTVCYGPNAIGKTTVARTIEAILWPAAVDGAIHAVATLSLGDERWRIELDHGHCTYECDGVPADPPALPAVHDRHRYRLPLHELLDAETRNEPFAETIARESAGGIDLAAAREALDYGASPSTRNVGAYRRAEEAIEAYEEATTAARALERDRETLPDLRAKRDRARRARSRVRLLEDVLAYHDLRTELAELDAQRDAYPDAMAAVTGDEAARVTELDAELEEWEETRAAAVGDREEAADALAAADLPDGGVPEGELEGLRSERDRLAELERQADAVEEDLAAARRTRKRCRADVPLDVETADLAGLEPVTWRELSAFCRAATDVAEREARAESLTRWAGADADTVPPDVEALERATTALEHWLAAGGAGRERDERYLVGLVAGSGATVVVVGVILAVVLAPIWGIVGVPGVVLVVALVWYLLRARAGDGPRAAHRSSFPDGRVEPPEEWTESAVRERLFALYDAVAERKRMAEGISRLEEIDVATARNRYESRRRELEAAIGDASELTEVGLTVAVKRILDWQEAHEAVLELETRQQELEVHAERTVDAINETLATYDGERVGTASEATAAIRALEARERDRAAAAQAIDRAEAARADAVDRIARLAVERRAVFAEVGLDEDDLAGLRSLCEQVEEYERVVEARVAAAGAETVAREGLVDREAFDPALFDADPETIEAELVDARATADRYDEFASRVTEIETRIDAATDETAVADAHLERERSLDALADQREADAGRMVGDVLVDHLQEHGVEADRPAVFERASELFARITAGTFRLAFDDGAGTFRAYDTVQDRGLALDELSSGTRVQLLLAVRLGFVERREDGTKLPVLLDETLANSDDERARAIIEALIALARDGRNVLYFTARRDEVGAWETALADADVTASIVDLAAEREVEARADLRGSVARDAIAPDPPAPNGEDLAAYGETLEVPPIDPYAEVGAVHLWYLVPDVDALYAACSVGIERWGQLETLLEVDAADEIGLNDETVETLRLRARAFAAMLASWRVGRGEPIDRTVLEATDAVSENFIDEVTALAREHEGNPRAVVDGLLEGEVARFRSGKARELEEYLYEQGYLEDAEPLPDGEIRMAMYRTLLDGGMGGEQADAVTTELLGRATIP